tara:strand:+ start:771 stop:1718 length:948 start_codon:yes stop_codon:yes gene_type:complete
MKTVQIVIHCLPREIDQLERLCNTLRENYYFVENHINVVLDVTLNLNNNFTDWKQSKISKDFFKQKFKNIENFNDWTYKNLFDIDEKNKCLGINDKRRNSINDGLKYDYIMYLDLDLYFPVFSFIPLVQLLDQLKDDYSIISLETVKLWDNTWDGLVNKKYKDKDYSYYKDIDPYRVNHITYENLFSDQGVQVKTINPIKFGGGWFNVFSKKLLKFINIPKSLGPYGLDDTFVMMASNMMKQKGYKIEQYVLEGIVCIENNKYTLYDYNPYKDFIKDISFKNKGRDFKQIYRDKSNTNFNKELNKFIKKIKNEKF